MGPEGKGGYVEAIRERYGRANRRGKKRILDEFCEVCGCHRKSAIRVLNGLGRKKGKHSGPKARYGAEVVEVLRAIWLGAEQACGKRLVGAIGLWLPAYERREGLKKEIGEALMRMSASTADRLLKPFRARMRKKGLGGTKPGSLLKTQIPIRGESWDEKRPGYLEADTVAHCGTNLAGDFVWSLTFTDIATGWTENRAVWNKGAAGVKERVQELEKDLPFKMRGFDCDNGSEFLNHHLWNYFQDRPEPIDFTRSRPYRKNDQAHVEQKNWTHVRQLLGYERLGRRELVEPANALYRTWGLLHNFFCPTLKLKAKTREGAKVQRTYEVAKTPCQRLLESSEVKVAAKARLRKTLKELDPFEIKRQVEVQLRRVFDLKRRLEDVKESTIPVSLNGHTSQVAFGNTLP